MKKLFILFTIALFSLPSVSLAASYSISFVGFPSSANVGDSIIAQVQVTNSSGTGSGTASITLTIDSTYFSTADSLTKTCVFSSSNTCTVSWSLTALRSGTKSVSAAGSSGSDTISSQSSSNVVITAPTSYTLTFTDNDADNILTASQTVTLILTVSNTGESATATADLSLTGFSLTSGSDPVSLGTIAEGGQASTTWTVQHDGSTTSPSATVTVTGGDTKSSSISFSYSAPSAGEEAAGGGGGGAAAEAAKIKVTTQKGKATITVPSIAAGKMANVTINKTEDMAVSRIEITVKNSVNNIQVVVTKLAQKPATIVQEVVGKVYHYIEVTKTNITDADVSKAKINFKVEKSWITANSINESTIALNRYADNKWNKLSTTKVSEDTTDIYFEAESTALSVFAITGEEKVATVTPPTEEKKPEEKKPEEKKEAPKITPTKGKGLITTIVVAIAAVGVIILLVKKNIIKLGKILPKKKSSWDELKKKYSGK